MGQLHDHKIENHCCPKKVYNVFVVVGKRKLPFFAKPFILDTEPCWPIFLLYKYDRRYSTPVHDLMTSICCISYTILSATYYLANYSLLACYLMEGRFPASILCCVIELFEQLQRFERKSILIRKLMYLQHD